MTLVKRYSSEGLKPGQMLNYRIPNQVITVEMPNITNVECQYSQSNQNTPSILFCNQIKIFLRHHSL